MCTRRIFLKEVRSWIKKTKSTFAGEIMDLWLERHEPKSWRTKNDRTVNEWYAEKFINGMARISFKGINELEGKRDIRAALVGQITDFIQYCMGLVMQFGIKVRRKLTLNLPEIVVLAIDKGPEGELGDMKWGPM